MGRGNLLPVSLLLMLVAVGAAPSVWAQPAFTFHTPDQGAIADLATTTQFATVITNTGSATDTLTIVMTKNLPTAWTASLCEGTICYPPLVTEISVVLAAGQDTVLEIDVTPLDVPGDGSVTVMVASGRDPQLQEQRDFTVLTPGLDVLVVAADDGAGLESFCTGALEVTGKSYGVWPRQQAGPFSQTDLASFGAIIWLSGPFAPGLTSADLGPLAYYVQHGGGLLLSGQDLAWSGCDPGSGDYSPATISWFQGILGVAYLSDSGGDDQLAGITTEPLLADFAGLLAGGTGANANSSPDAVQATTGTASLTYQNGATAAVRHTYGNGHSFFGAFGLENLATEANRLALIESVLAWFDPPSAVPEGRPRLTARLQPNPFNPATTLAWHLPTAGPLRITVHDLSGRRVAVLLDDPAEAGPGSLIWQGKNEAGRDLPSGVYLCRLQQGAHTVMRKMTLVR